jgi:DNA-binding GntR family transcriptional regulator
MRHAQYERRRRNGKRLQETKTDTAVDHLRQAILKGEILPGEWLRQEELAERFGISPTPIREALRRLEAEGLVEYVRRSGVKVVAYTIETAHEYYDMRAMVESYAVRIAAAQRTDQDIEHLQALVRELREVVEQSDMLRLTEMTWQLHDRIISLCRSRLVLDVLARVRRSFQLDTLLLMPERAAAALSEHQAILDAIIRGDGEEAAVLMSTNIESTRSAMMAHFPGARTHTALQSSAKVNFAKLGPNS